MGNAYVFPHPVRAKQALTFPLPHSSAMIMDSRSRLVEARVGITQKWKTWLFNGWFPHGLCIKYAFSCLSVKQRCNISQNGTLVGEIPLRMSM